MGTNSHEGFQEHSYQYDAHHLVERALAHEYQDVPMDLRNDKEFRSALGLEVATLLRREQADEAEEVVEDLEIPSEVLHSDAVHSAALTELTHLEESYAEKIPDIIRLMRIFELSWDDVPGEVREAIQNYGHFPDEYPKAA